MVSKDFYATSDINLMPPLHGEPCAMVLFEAASARKAIVATATGGTPEIIKNGVNGLLFPRDDDEALCQAIEKLLLDKVLMRAMGEQAYEKAKTDFLEKPVCDLENVYRTLMHQ